MNRDPEISHDAIVKSVDKGHVTVSLSSGVSCSGCRAAGACGMSGNSDREIKVNGTFDLHPGQQVMVSIKGSQGYLALFLGYLLPLILVVVTLLTLSSVNAGELLSGLFSFGILIPYYIILWTFRSSIGKKFSFTVKTAI